MKTISIIGKDCVGCRSCELSCPKKCIDMVKNKEGFLYPHINDELCIECGVCLKKCPVHECEKEQKKEINAYAFKEKNEEDRFFSASGGVSDTITKYILKLDGVVFGAAYNKELVVQHIEVKDDIGRKKIQSSKYVQSDLGDSYLKTKEHLKKNKIVLFTGTPCQIAGLYAYLGREYDNLYTIDLVCHGVPSPRFFKRYLEYQEKKMGEKIESYNFRSKEKNGWATQCLIKTKSKKKTKPLALDKYGQHFMSGDCYRECCYSCHYSNQYHPADLTVGDFWGVEKRYADFYSDLGVSLILANSQKGKELLGLIKSEAEIMEITVEDVLIKQTNLSHSTKRPVLRNTIYNDINKEDYFEKMKIGLQLKARIKAVLPKKVKKILKQYV